LTHAVFREFAKETNDVVSAKLFAFKEDGHIFMDDRDLLNRTVEEREVSYSAAENWEEYPRFGDYTSLCREQRTART
jgi:hypothetical protein